MKKFIISVLIVFPAVIGFAQTTEGKDFWVTFGQDEFQRVIPVSKRYLFTHEKI
jgi:hypothetical protein